MSTAPRWSVEGRGWPNAAHSRFVEAGGVRWHVQILGDGPPLLLLHGAGAATHSWRALAPLLAARFTVIAPDLPGHGFTTGRLAGGVSMQAMSRAVGALARALGVTEPAIVGHSAGAAIAVRMALDGEAGPRAIVGLGAALQPFPGLAARPFPAFARLLFVNPLAPRIFAQMARAPGETARFLIRSTGSRIDAEGVRCYTRLFSTPGHCAGALAMMAGWDLDRLWRDLPRLETPLHLFHGEGDAAIPIATAHAAAARVRHGGVTALPGLGHLAHEERPEAAAAIIRRFVETG